MVFQALIDEIINFVWYFFSFVKKDLFFVILPVQGQIFDANIVPVVLELRTSSVDNARHFICDDEL